MTSAASSEPSAVTAMLLTDPFSVLPLTRE